jgi:HJR/Mrr/RecB family endonuclease
MCIRKFLVNWVLMLTKSKINEYTEEEMKILSKPIGELSPEEFEILKNIFIRKGFSPPIILKAGDNMCSGFGGNDG